MAMSAAGLGIGLYPGSWIPGELRPTTAFVHLSDCSIVRQFRMVTAANRPQSPAAAAFAHFLRASVSAEDGWPS